MKASIFLVLLCLFNAAALVNKNWEAVLAWFMAALAYGLLACTEYKQSKDSTKGGAQ